MRCGRQHRAARSNADFNRGRAAVERQVQQIFGHFAGAVAQQRQLQQLLVAVRLGGGEKDEAPAFPPVEVEARAAGARHVIHIKGVSQLRAQRKAGRIGAETDRAARGVVREIEGSLIDFGGGEMFRQPIERGVGFAPREALRRKRRLQRIAELHIQLADGGGFEIPVDFGDVARFHFSSETFPVAVST